MEKVIVDLLASLTTNSAITIVEVKRGVYEQVLRDVTVGEEYPVGRFLHPGDTTKSGDHVNSYGVEFLDDACDVVSMSLTEGGCRWKLRNVATGKTITSESGEAETDPVQENMTALIEILKVIDPESAAYAERVSARLAGLSDEDRLSIILEELEDLFKEEEKEPEFSPGDFVKCVRSEHPGSIFYQVGEIYIVAKVNAEGAFTLKGTVSDQENHFLAPVGNIWEFEKV